MRLTSSGSPLHLPALRAAGTALALILLGGPACAAHVQPLHEAELDAIFSQPSFGANTIDIRFNPARALYNPDWQRIEADWAYIVSYGLPEPLGQMTAQVRSSLPAATIPLFYVDDFTFDGVPGGVVGLGFVGAPGVAIKADVQRDLSVREPSVPHCPPEQAHLPSCYIPVPGVTQAQVDNHRWYAASVLAHEIGHNLGLQHADGPGLMQASAADDSFSFLLTVDQVSTLLMSPLVQTDAKGQRFISITPYAVLGTPPAVPEPSTAALGLYTLGMIGWRVRRHAAPARNPA